MAFFSSFSLSLSLIFFFLVCEHVKIYQDGMFDQLIFDTSDGYIQVRSQSLQCGFMQQPSQELHKSLEEIVQSSTEYLWALAYSALHLSVCHGSLGVSKCPTYEADFHNFNFLFNCIFNLYHLTKAASSHDLAELLSFHWHPYLRRFTTKKRLYGAHQAQRHWK